MSQKSDALEDYQDRMSGAPQFQYFGIRPEWNPGTGDIDGFIHDEVVRQFHDPRVHDDGGCRVKWMTHAWGYAIEQSAEFKHPTLGHIELLGSMIEPKENRNGFRTGNVYINNEKRADPRDVPALMTRLWQDIDLVLPRQGLSDRENVFIDESVRPTADEFYLEFERIHPFGDGNGRSGKILHNWLLGTLEEPVLVADYFGGHNP